MPRRKEKKKKKKRHVLERHETRQVNHLSELGQIIDTFLNFLQAIANAVALKCDLEKRVTHRAL